MIRPWTVTRTRVDSENRIFTLKTRTALSPRTGREHDFYVLEADPWVNVVPVTPEGRVVMVRQYRHGTDETTLEIPGGLVDAGQTPLEAATRELAEETGYQSPSLELIGRVRPNPAILDNWCYSYLASDAQPTENRRLDEAEDLEVVLIDLGDVPAMIADGRIDHALVVCAFHFFFSRERAGL